MRGRVFVIGVGTTKFEKPGARLALQHGLGLDGAGVVAMYRKADFS